MTGWEARGRTIIASSDHVPKVMGIVNLTPDSFSDGGRHSGSLESIAFAHRLAGQGASLLDLGGESSRPGAEPVSLEQEIGRVVPVVQQLSKQLAIPISIDTTKAE